MAGTPSPSKSSPQAAHTRSMKSRRSPWHWNSTRIPIIRRSLGYRDVHDQAEASHVFLRADCAFPWVTITLLSFAVFWTDTESADALGYGISVIVVNLLSTVVIIGLLPVCGELIWIDLFCFVNTTFCCLALAQSAFNIMLENKKDDSLLPLWLRRCFKKSTVFESMRIICLVE